MRGLKYDRGHRSPAFVSSRPSKRWAVLLPALFISATILLSTARAETIPAELKPIHLLNRLAFGPRPGDLERVRTIGIERYIQEQLSPETIPLPSALARRLEDLSTLRQNPLELFAEYGPAPGGKKLDPEAAKQAQQRARVILREAAEARILRAVESPRQLQEVMVNFWFNHFNVFAGKGLDRLWVGAYEEQAIRPYALGRFRDLLEASATHPAMLFYLDNWQNTAPGSRGARGPFKGLNENYARELMELHTLGVDGGYTQQDVIALARILTGWTMRPRGGAFRAVAANNGFFFDPNRHDFSDKLFLGRAIAGSGMSEGEEALDLLARTPATAHHIAFELAQYFVADQPPRALVDRMAKRFRESDGDIRSVLETLFHSPEFWSEKYYGKKFKTPYEYVISAVRAAGVEVKNTRPLLGMMQQLGMPLYGCQTPDGYKNSREAWLNPSAMTQRLSFAAALASGHLPIDRPPPDSMSRMGDGGETIAVRPARPTPVEASQLEGVLGAMVSPKSRGIVEAEPERLRSAALLGSPDFMQR